MNRPFEAKDVLWRWTPTEEQQRARFNQLASEYALVYWDDPPAVTIVFGLWGDDWHQVDGDVPAELLRQLRESQEREKKYHDAIESILGHCAERGDVKDDHLLRCIESDANEALVQQKPQS